MANFCGNDQNHSMKMLRKYAPEQFKAFAQFDRNIFKHGALTKKEKEIIAVAVAHVTKCHYCIDVHIKKAKAQGATLEELVEAVFVVSAVEAGEVMEHASLAYANFYEAAFKQGNISGELKALIAVAATCILQNFELMDYYTKQALERGATKEQIIEAKYVASALKAGSVYAHMIHLYESFIE